MAQGARPDALAARGLLFLVAVLLQHGRSQDTPWINVEYDMVEELPIGTQIGDIRLDAELVSIYGDSLQRVTFSFQPNQEADAELFMVEETSGIFRTAQDIDRDTMCPGAALCTREVRIKVIGPNREYQLVKVLVTIIDLNDNAPTFTPAMYQLTVSENAPANMDYPLPTARDHDSGLYGIQSYKLEPDSQLFSLSVVKTPDSGFELKLYVNEMLDREETDIYSVQLIAQDGGKPQSRQGTLHVTINVGDANDNRPVFQNASYAVDVSESFPLNQTLLQVRAVDRDAGLNGQIAYSLSYDSQQEFGRIFAINPNTGEIYLKRALDYEEHSAYKLTITAQDLGSASVPTNTKVTVHVLDVNDFPPQITVNGLSTTGQVSIPENSAARDLVADIQVHDSDSGPGGNVDCTLRDPYFAMEQYYTHMYHLLALRTFDREEHAMYTVTIRCQDHGSPTLTSSLTIPVEISDINDHSPEFSRHSYTFSVAENNPVGATLMVVNATDRDSGLNSDLTYQLMGNVNNLLAIDSNTGRIYSTAPLDYESRRHISMTVEAADKGSPLQSNTVLVDLIIQDIDDEPPVFAEANYSYITLENQEIGTEIATVTATDVDSEYVMYSLEPRNSPTELFQIDPSSGRITIRQMLDREALLLQSMVVVAQGGNGPSSSIIVTVHVADVNDNAPLITFPNEANNTVHVPYSAPEAYVFAHVLATDADFKENNDLIYSIGAGDEDHLFNIDAITGVMSTNAPLFDIEQETHDLQIVVRDQGNPPKSAVEHLYIVINHTMPFIFPEGTPLPRRDPMLNQNETILISMSVVTTILVFILIFAIIYVKRKHPKREDHYKCKVDYTDPNTATRPPPRCVSRTVASSGDSLDLASSSESSLPQHSRLKDQLDSSRDSEDNTLGTRTSSIDGSQQLHLQGTPVSVHPYPGQGSPRYGPSPVPPPGQAGLKPSNLPRHRLLEDPRNLPRSWSPHCSDKDLEVHRLLHMVMQEPTKPDSDNASGCSAEVSNTDSGRGASEDGDGLHAVPPPPPNLSRNASPGTGHYYDGSNNSLRGRGAMPRDMAPRAHIAYVAPNRHVRKPMPSNVSSFKQSPAGLPQPCQPVPEQLQPIPYCNYPPKRGIHFGPFKNPPQPQPPPYNGNSNSLKRDGSLQRSGAKDCGCHSNCNHRRTFATDLRSQGGRERSPVNAKDPRDCEMKPVNGWPTNTMKLDKVSYLDSVV